MTIVRVLCLFLICTVVPATAQDRVAPLRDTEFGRAEIAPDPSATGGASKLEDIMRRQRGEIFDAPAEEPRFDENVQSPSATEPLGVLGGVSDPDLWRAVRHNSTEIRASSNGPAATTLIQDGGMWWLQVRRGPLTTYGGYLLLGMVALMALFYLLVGRIRTEGRKSGRTLTRFIGVERFAHWLLSGSFLLLALTGLLSLFGRKVLIPAFGHESFAAVAMVSKWVHDNVSWAFMVALVLVFVLWVWDNLPDRSDLTWIRQGGGILRKGHPPAKKFNVGQKVVFWAVIVLGASISLSGLSLLFPFQLPLFEPTFDKINALGLPGLFGFAPIDTALALHEEMQLAQLWHAIVGFGLMAIIIGHIYLGTLGMEGAFSAMGSGQVGEEWAEQHHSIWAEKKKAEERNPRSDTATPAE